MSAPKRPDLRRHLSLTNVEYLCLKMHLNPGRPGRWYLRMLHQYRFGVPGTGSWNGLYLSRGGRYRDALWEDAAPQTVSYPGPWGVTRQKSTVGQFRLTRLGRLVALRAARKIGVVL